VVHTHNPQPHYFGVAAARLARVPALVHTKHGRNRPDKPRRVALNSLAARLSDRVVCVSSNAETVARRTERVPPKKLCLIRNGVALPEFVATARPRDAAKRAIHVARLNVVKDQRTLLRAVRLVADELPDFVLEIVGDGEERKALECLCDELRLSDHVRFLGERSDVSSLLGGARLFVLSSLGEGLSMTLLEAMASALPIVATAVGGNAEVVVHGETGLLVPPRSPQQLAAAMLELVRDPDKASQMGQAGRRRVEAEFDMQRVAARYESLYHEVLAAR
jgi:glycosyltransferase involved in cell wall biosynthesis